MQLLIRILLIINIGSLFIFAQNNYNPIVGRWEFQSLSISYFSDPLEKEEISKNDKYFESIVFLPYGQFSFQGKSDGDELVGNGTYEINGQNLTTNVNDINTITKFSINGNMLTINKYEKESDDFYAMETVFFYKKDL